MASYLQLQAEPWWGLEREAPAHADLTARLRAKWNLNKSQCGSKGDDNHLQGRHRSRSWTANSKYCTNRAYGNTDRRDKTGDGNWLRGSDIGLSGPALWAMCRRLDDAVRAGRLPCVAEWFGTFNGKTVVGWYQGKPSTSDDSHLYHGHVGLWTSYCDNPEQLRLLGDILTGEDNEMTAAQEYVQHVMNYRLEAVKAMRDPIKIPAFTATDGTKYAALTEPNLLAQAIKAIPLTALPVDVDEAAIAAAVAAQIDVPTAAENAEAVLDLEAQRLKD